ncbi:MAG: replicative DNA helicase [Candidatus Pacebacteria bacterium]|nr:replicative DNA helicase [Candidatus Paceibacterota bacterium]
MFSDSPSAVRGDRSGLSDRLPPQNLDAERSVLGAMLLDNRAIDEVASIIRRADDFYRDAHQVVYRAIRDMHDEGKAVDAVTLADELTLRGQYKQIGGDNLLTEIANSVPHAANARHHADILKQKSVTRRLIQSCTDIIDKGYSNLYTSKQLQEEAERSIQGIADDRAVGSAVPIDVVMKDMMDNIALAKGGEFHGIPTGIVDLDRLIKGLMAEKMYVLAARTGEGKTALALRIAQHAAINKNSTLFVSLEMGGDELGHRWTSALAKIDSRRLTDNDEFNSQECAAVAKAASIMAKARLHVSDAPNQTMMDIAACARRIKQKDALDLVVVDYMALISEEHGNNENRTQVVGRLSRGMKMLARELKIPVLVLHQLNRESAKENREPKLHDLRESGSVEQDADVVILLHSKMDEADKQGEVTAIVAKHRGGPRGRVSLWYDKRYNTFDCTATPGRSQEEPDPTLEDFDSFDSRPF